MQKLLSTGMDIPQCKQNSLCFTSSDDGSEVFEDLTPDDVTSFDAFDLRKTKAKTTMRRMITITSKIEFNDCSIPGLDMFSVVDVLIVGVEVVSSSLGKLGDGEGVVGEVGEGVVG